jgi:hypothetical protein
MLTNYLRSNRSYRFGQSLHQSIQFKASADTAAGSVFSFGEAACAILSGRFSLGANSPASSVSAVFFIPAAFCDLLARPFRLLRSRKACPD